MNEPGARVDSPTRRVDLAPETMEGAERYFGGTHRPTWGITVGVKPLLASREVWLLATGSSKAPVLHRLATEPVGATLPASYLHVHPELHALRRRCRPTRPRGARSGDVARHRGRTRAS